VSKADSPAEEEEMVFLSTLEMQMSLTFRYSNLAAPLTTLMVVLRYSNEGGRELRRKIAVNSLLEGM
jgi:hypothetical protein